jgi:hypothetical protein
MRKCRPYSENLDTIWRARKRGGAFTSCGDQAQAIHAKNELHEHPMRIAVIRGHPLRQRRGASP